MSVKKLALAVLCILFFSTNSQAALQFTFSPEFGVMGGTTEYEMDIKGYFIVDDGTTLDTTIRRVTSLLEFPLDISIGGVSGEVHSIEDPMKWSLGIKYLTNLNNPNSKMIDTDWDEVQTKFPYTKWSETNSDAEINMTILDAEARFRIVQKSSMDISILAGGRYQKIYQDIIGLDGWQRQFDTVAYIYEEPFYFSRYDNEVVGTYELKLKHFKVGMQSDIYLSNLFTSQFKIVFAPVFFDDTDDHVLRKKLSTASGDGKGFIAGFNLRYNNSKRFLSYIQLSTSYNYFTANGSQVQKWYGDDPGTSEDDTGDIISGIPHIIRTKQYSISLQIGLTL